jgi:hypothetical protein
VLSGSGVPVAGSLYRIISAQIGTLPYQCNWRIAFLYLVAISKPFLWCQSSGGGVAGAFGAIIVFIMGEEN